MSSAREKRIAMGIILGTLALTALFLAQGTTRLVAASVLGGQHAEPVASGGPSAGASSRQAAASVRDRKNPDPILQKNIFDSQSGDLTREPEDLLSEEELPEATEEGFTIPEGEVQVCSGGARLVGTIVAPRSPEWSFAALNASGEAMLYRTGMDVEGMTLVGIRSDRVFMAPESGPLCKLQMFMLGEAPASKPSVARSKEKDDDGAKSRREKLREKMRARRKGPISDEELEQGIQKVSETEYNVDQSLVSKLLENQAELMKSARIIPQDKGGRVNGVKLYGIRRNSVLGKLGIQNGDLLRNINGFDMTSPDSALEAYTKLRNADHLTVAIVRRGDPTTIDYNIQ